VAAPQAQIMLTPKNPPPVGAARGQLKAIASPRRPYVPGPDARCRRPSVTGLPTPGWSWSGDRAVRLRVAPGDLAVAPFGSPLRVLGRGMMGTVPPVNNIRWALNARWAWGWRPGFVEDSGQVSRVFARWIRVPRRGPLGNAKRWACVAIDAYRCQTCAHLELLPPSRVGGLSSAGDRPP